MRKEYKTYLIIWVLLVLLFNIVIFAIPSSIDGKTIIEIVQAVSAINGGKIDALGNHLLQLANYLMNSGDSEMVLYKYGGAFWPGYVCIMLAFIAQLLVSRIAFKEKNNQKFFYKVPLITISYTGLIMTLIVGIITMFYPNFPIWLGVCLCVLIAVIVAFSIIRANAAAEFISSVDDKTNAELSFYRETIKQIENLRDSVDDQLAKDELSKLYETIRYSDPSIIEKNKKEIGSVIKELIKSLDKENISNSINSIKKLLSK